MRIEQLSKLVRGQRVLVLGSGPLTRPLELSPEQIVVACNGGISHVPADEVVHAWSVNARESIIESRVETNRAMMRQGADRSIPFAILHTRGGDAGVSAFLRVMKAQKTSIAYFVSLESQARRALADAAGAYDGSLMRDQVISNGLLTVALCLSHGARSVVMNGFSWKAGYHYETKTEVKARGHVSADKGAMSNLMKRYPGAIETTLQVPRIYTGPVVEPGQIECIMVRATAAGFYGGHRRRVNAEFPITHRAHVRPWMEVLEVRQTEMKDAEPATLEVENG